MSRNSKIIRPFDHTFKIMHHPDQLKKLLDGGRPFPIHLEVDLTNVCNHSCYFCNCADTLASDNSILQYEILLNRLEEGYEMGARGISFTGGGEPVMHPKFAEICKKAKSIGYDLGLITNGSLIRKEKLRAIADNFNWVRISLGGVTQETYLKVQGKDDFQKVLKNVFLLKEESNKKRKLNLGLKIMLVEKNIEHCDKLIQGIQENNLTCEHLDYIQFIPDQFTNDGGAFVRSDLVRNTMENLRKNLEQLNIPLYGAYFSVKEEERDLSFSSKCYAHFYQIAIAANGDMTFCKNCRDTKSLIVGNIYQSTLSEIWGSNHLKNLENKINANNCNTFCKSLKINNLIHAIKNPDEDYSQNFF